MSYKKILSILSVAVLGYSSVSAATFSANQGGALGTSSVIDANGTGDYSSLAEAAADFSSYPGGATANYSFLIRSDLDEPASVPFGNATNGNTVTLKPDAGSSVTLTFSATADNPGTGITGDIIIGSNTYANFDNLVPTHNFVIDGSNNGTDSRNLTIRRDVGAFAARTFRIVGDCDGFTLKNTTIFNKATGANAVGVSLNQRASAASDNVVITNNHIQANSSASHVIIHALTGESSGIFGNNLLVENNTLIGGQRIVYMANYSNVKILNNVIRHRLRASGWTSQGIAITSNASDAPDNVYDIIGNVFEQFHSAVSNTTGIGTGHGITAIEVSITGVATANIINNVVAGSQNIASSSATPFTTLYRGISISGAGISANILHNSINLNHFSTVSPLATPTNIVAINLINGPSYNVQNNLVVHAQEEGALGVRATAKEGSILDNNNIFVASPTSFYGRYGTDYYVTLADFQAGAAGAAEAASTSLDTRIANAPGVGHWISDSDLRFNGEPGDALRGVPLAEVTVDALGTPRSNVAPTKGAYEFAPTSGVAGWQLY